MDSNGKRFTRWRASPGLAGGSVETLHRTNRPEILNKHRQKPMGIL